MAPPNQPHHSSFNESRIRLLRLIRQIEREVESLRRLTLFLLDTDDASPDQIDTWFQKEGFAAGSDGQFLPRPSWERLKRGQTIARPELSYFWPEPLRNDPVLRAHFHALRHLAGPLSESAEHLQQLPQYLYFQDAHNGVITYPFIDSQGVIPPDFDWKTYYPWKFAGPDANPQRSFKWITPMDDFGSQGPFIIGALPVYREDDCIGIWALDIPLSRFLCLLFPEPIADPPPFFVVDTQGNIVLHPQLGPVERPGHRSLLWKPIASLGGGFAQLDLAQLQGERHGQKHLINGEGRMVEITFQSLPNLNWIFLGIAPCTPPQHPELTDPVSSPPDLKTHLKLLALCRSQADILTGWEQSYQTLIQRFSAVFFTLSPTFPAIELYISPQIEQMVGYKAPEFFADPTFWRSLVIPEDLPDMDRRLKEFIDGGESLSQLFRVRTRAGEIKWLHEEAVLIRDITGKPLLIQGWLFDITGQKTTEENLRLRETEIHALSNRLLELQEVEHRNISAVLHDHMGQLLTLARLEIESLKITSDNRNSRDRCLSLIDDSLKTVRSLASSLHPPFLEDLELPQILALIIENFKSGAHLSIDLNCEPHLPPVPSPLKTALYRIVGEALTNVVRHAGARAVQIRLRYQDTPPGLILTLNDDGHGFDLSQPRHSGIGLIGMRERIHQLGGEFSLTSAIGKGTHITLFLPTSSSPRTSND